jgi:F-type H+-transporting ATPase subunit delta
VFQIAIEREELETWQGDLETLAAAVENPEISGILDAPQVPKARKSAVIDEALTGSVEPLALNLLKVLASRSMTHQTPGILDEYLRLLDAHRGIERAEVVAAVPLDTGQRARISELLEGVAGKEVRLASTTEPRILGGLVAKIGDRVIDGSLKTKLDRMRSELSEGQS